MNQEFRFKNIDETRNYFLEKIKQSELMSRKDKKVCANLNSAITGCTVFQFLFSLLSLVFL